MLRVPQPQTPPEKPVLLTGASGALGRDLAQRLGAAGWTLRLTDVVPPLSTAELPPRATFAAADLSTDAGAAALSALAEGCCAVLHFAAQSVERPYADVEGPNLRGCVAAFDAAASSGARVVFASSNHVVGLHARTQPAPLAADSAPLRPDGFYGLSKCFGELLARMYAAKRGVPAVLLRIGSCTPEPTDARMLSTWLSRGDLAALVECAVRVPEARLFEGERAGVAVVWGASNNAQSFWGPDDRALLGWTPKDSADGFAERLSAATSGNPVAEHFQGGAFAAIGWTAALPVAVSSLPSSQVATAAAAEVFETHAVRRDVPFCLLDCTRAWDGLSEPLRLYAHHLAMASWAGAPICLHQTSPEAPAIFALIQRAFRNSKNLQQLLLAESRSKESAAAMQKFVEFCASFLGNMGNYLSFGDTKLIPRCTRQEFQNAVLELCGETVDAALLDAIFSLDPPRLRQLGLGDSGISTYYAGDVTEADISAVQKLLDTLGIHPSNTRLAKLPDGSFRVRIASANTSKPHSVHELCNPGGCGGPKVTIEFGDFSKYLSKVVAHLEAALAVAPNKLEADMLRAYIEHFKTGDVEAHKTAQRIWIGDKAPPVETNIGFIESYRDPAGVRAEWEGWVAIVDAVGSKQLDTLVERAPVLLPLLPWSEAMLLSDDDGDDEHAGRIQRDFTAIDVVAYGCSGVPLGINLPNYTDVRQECGYKNVALGNSMRAVSPGERLTFLGAEDEALVRANRSKAAEIHVGLHELLGHGSGRLFVETSNGKLPFDPAKIINPLDGKPISSWYRAGQTYESVFGELASPMEECRAECVGVLLSTEPKVLEVFGIADCSASAVHDVTFTNWLSMTRSGLLALEFFTPMAGCKHGGKWRQAHMRARFAILKTLLEAGVAHVELVGDDDARIKLDRGRILSDGVPAIRSLLTRIQVYRSTANAAAAESDFGTLTAVQEETDALMAKLRRCAIAQRMPRRVFVQPHTILGADGKVQLHNFDPSPAGMIASFQARFPDDDAVDLLGCAI